MQFGWCAIIILVITIIVIVITIIVIVITIIILVNFMMINPPLTQNPNPGIPDREEHGWVPVIQPRYAFVRMGEDGHILNESDGLPDPPPLRVAAKADNGKEKGAKADNGKEKGPKVQEAKAQEAKGKEAQGKEAQGKETKGKEAKGKEAKGKEAKGKESESAPDTGVADANTAAVENKAALVTTATEDTGQGQA